jgi:2-keto-3-deoxy-L-rhamnonate aldolase RhmA
MKAGKELKRRIETETLTLGTLATFQLSVSLVDISINAGLDYLIVDLEHFSHSHQTVADVCTVGRLANFPVLIRPPSVETETLHVIMDLGPCGLLIPYVQSTETLDQVRKFTTRPGRRKWKTTSSCCPRSRTGLAWPTSSRSPPIR